MAPFDAARPQVDIPINQAFKAAARVLAGASGVPMKLRRRLHSHVQLLGGVTDVPLTQLDIAQCRRQRRLDSVTAFLLEICDLVRRSALVRPEGAEADFADLRASAQKMGAVFEAFLYEFLRREQQEFAVSRPHLAWRRTEASSPQARYLPTMKTDVVLESARQRIVIEAKCTAKMTSRHMGGHAKLRSDHLYQVLNYLRHVPEDRSTTGLLLYAQSGKPLALELEIDGRRLMVRSLNLDQPWEGIHDDLLDVVGQAKRWAA
jgi:5-methylcytosine-specific restriction enzyme subunit McrC